MCFWWPFCNANCGLDCGNNLASLGQRKTNICPYLHSTKSAETHYYCKGVCVCVCGWGEFVFPFSFLHSVNQLRGRPACSLTSRIPECSNILSTKCTGCFINRMSELVQSYFSTAWEWSPLFQITYSRDKENEFIYYEAYIRSWVLSATCTSASVQKVCPLSSTCSQVLALWKGRKK